MQLGYKKLNERWKGGENENIGYKLWSIGKEKNGNEVGIHVKDIERYCCK